MANELLDTNQDVPEDVGAAEETSSKEELSQDEILAMIEKTRAEAKTEAREQAEAAFTRSQSLIDKNIARERATWQSQYQSLQERYESALAKYGADPGDLEALHRQTQTEMEMQELRNQARAYQELKAQTEAERGREAFVREKCREYNIGPDDERLDQSDPYAFVESILLIQSERLARRAKDAAREEKKKDLEALKEAGGLDVTGGGAAMAPPAWSTANLILGSEESAISEHIIHYYENLTVEELGQKISKVQQLIKQEPRLSLKEASRRVHDMEKTGH